MNVKVLPAQVLLARCPPEFQQKIDWYLSAARTLRAQANQDARVGNIAQAKQLTAQADNFQLIAENILLKRMELPELEIPPLPGAHLLPRDGRTQ